MSKRRNIRARLQTLGSLREVLESMRNLAMVEIGKLSRTQQCRRHLLEELTAVAAAAAVYYPPLVRPGRKRLYIVIGSERGFCGDFNERLIESWNDIRVNDPDGSVIIIGEMLAERLSRPRRLVATLSGPTTSEDIDATLVDLLAHITAFQATQADPIGLVAVSKGSESVAAHAILPFEPPREQNRRSVPQLYLTPETFVREFTDHFVDAALRDLFATSFLAENHARLEHMTAAIERLDGDAAALLRLDHRLRQEEITQEVETILLSAEV